MSLINTPGITPTQVMLHTCSIAGVDFRTIVNGEIIQRFHVQEFRVYEDNCKFYFTGQLVIEAQQNVFERFLAPQAEVVLSFQAPPNDKIYTEKFRVYSYESKPREGDLVNSMIVTIALVGEEYFKDKSTQVQMNFNNQSGTSAASQIHQKDLSFFGPLAVPLQSLGMIGLQNHAHQVLSKSPSKAIHDILDKSVFPVPSSGPAVYFRNKPGYVIAPLEHLIKNAQITGNFLHYPRGGDTINSTLSGYNLVIHFRPMAPPGEDRGGARPHVRTKTVGWNDLAQGITKTLKGAGGSGYAGGVAKGIIDNWRQNIEIDKMGPGGYKSREDQFISDLTYSQKYWMSVPLQTGIEVTVGDRITIVYPVGNEIHTKTLWVARLIHELRFTEGRERNTVAVHGTTDLFGVYWNV